MTAALWDPGDDADPDGDTLPLDLGPLPDVEPGRIRVQLPRRRVLTFPRPPARDVSDERRAGVKRIRPGVPVLIESPDGSTVPGTWNAVTRGTGHSYWVCVPGSDAAVEWAELRDIAQLDAHAYSLVPLRHVA